MPFLRCTIPQLAHFPVLLELVLGDVSQRVHVLTVRFPPSCPLSVKTLAWQR